MSLWSERKGVGVLIFSALLDEVIMHSPEDDDTEQCEIVVLIDQAIYAEDELSEPRLLRETHFDVRGTTICVSRSYPLFHSFTSILESR